MSAAAIIRAAEAEGLRLELNPAGAIEAIGDAATIERWLPVLRACKAELVQALRHEAKPAALPVGADEPAPPRLTPEQRADLTARLVAAPGYRAPMEDEAEIQTFIVRECLFRAHGLTAEIAEAEANKLLIRDREGDDRRLCLECRHLQGAGRWRCGNWQQAGVARDGLARDLVLMLQRCDGYHPALQAQALSQTQQAQPKEHPHD